MRIGFFTETFLPQSNGVVTSIESFGEKLADRGHDVTVLCPKSDRTEHLGMRVVSFPALTFKPYPDFRLALPIAQGHRVPELDIVHTHGPFMMGRLGLKTAKKQGVPAVSTFHTVLAEYVNYLSRYGKNFLKTITWAYCFKHYSHYDGLITPSDALRKILAERLDMPIAVIPTGIDMMHFKPTAKEKARHKLGLNGDRIFLCLGRLSAEKKIDEVLRAFAEHWDLRHSRLIIAGRGPEEERLRTLAKQLGIGRYVTFAGFVPEKLKPLYYSAADAFVISAVNETQAIVCAEAMACGTPVIGAASLAIPEIVTDGYNGFLFDTGDKWQLAQLLNEFKPSARLSSNALRTAGKFSDDKSVDKLEKFYARFA